MPELISPAQHPQMGLALRFDLLSEQTQQSATWEFADRRLSFLFLPAGSEHSLIADSESATCYVKVILGQLESPKRGCFAAPFAVRSTRADTETLVTGNEGALVALLAVSDSTPAQITAMDSVVFRGPLAEHLGWQSFETRFGEHMDAFNGLDCHMMDGFHLQDHTGDHLCYVNIWSCGKGVDLTTHNHGQPPREGAPAFAEVHWVLDAATSTSGMYRTAEPGDPRRQRYPMVRGEEHGPYFEFDDVSRLPIRRDNGAVAYGWHGWQGGVDGEPGQAYDLVAAFELSPEYAHVGD